MPQDPIPAPDSEQPIESLEATRKRAYQETKTYFEQLWRKMNGLLGRTVKSRDSRAPIGWVYFVATPEIRKIKIGHTNNTPCHRLKALSADFPFDLEPFGILRGSSYIESKIHGIFRPIHWKREWFHDHPILRRFIFEEGLPWSAADEVYCYQSIDVFEATRMIEKVVAKLDKWVDQNRVALDRSAEESRESRFCTAIDPAEARRVADFLLAHATMNSNPHPESPPPPESP